jgi:hypothetical protein
MQKFMFLRRMDNVDPDAEAISYLAGTVTIRQHSEYVF